MAKAEVAPRDVGSVEQFGAIQFWYGVVRFVLSVLATLSGFQMLPLFVVVIAAIPLWIGMLFAMLSVLGLPAIWPRLLREEIIVFAWNRPVWMFIANSMRVLELIVVPVPRLVFPQLSRKISAALLPVTPRVLRIEEPAVVEPSAEQRQNARANCSKEAWFFLNGICTTRDMAQGNAEAIFNLFGRPVTIIHNPTDSLLPDLVECFVGKMKSRDFKTEPRTLAMNSLRAALLDESVEKVVLLAHSQGTIIASNVLADLNGQAGQHAQLAAAMHKLELFSFATCSQRLVVGSAGHVESLCNEWDVVAMMGPLCPTGANVKDVYGQEVLIEGNILKEQNKYGHMFVVHYLNGLAAGQYKGSRLHGYK